MTISLKVPKSLRNLRLDDFLTLLDLISTRSFSETAKKQGITQSAVSYRIKEMEKALGGIKLFHRNSRNFVLNPEGNLVKQFSEELREMITSLLNNIQDISNQNRVQVVIASSSIPGEFLLPKLFMSFQKKYPEFIFQIHISNTRNSINQLFHDKSRFCALGDISNLNLEEIEFKVLGEDEIKIIARKGHPIFRDLEKIGYYKSNPKVYKALLEYPWIFREKGSATRGIFLEQCPISDQIKPKLELHNNTAIIHAVENSDALSALSSFTLTSLGNGAQIIPVEHPSLKKIKRKFYLVKRKNLPLFSAEQAFWDFCGTNGSTNSV